MVRKMFEPCNIGSLKLKNRIIMLPMGDGMAGAYQEITQQHIDYFAARARGGVGLIIQTVGASPEYSGLSPRFDLDSQIHQMSHLTNVVHSYGAKIGVMFAATGRLGGGLKSPKGPSVTPCFFNPAAKSTAFTTEEVYKIIKDYGAAAFRAKRGGYDLVHLQAYGGYLIDQFMSEIWNQRTDEFGGSFENRMRVPMMLIAEIQKTCGKDFPLIFKMSPVHLIEGGRKLEEGLEVARMAERAGVAAIHVDIGCYENWYNVIPPVYHQERVAQFEYAAKIKEVVRIPVYTQGKVGDPYEAEAVFREGKTDFVALGRSFLADPDWVRKVREERVEDIRPCICCNEGCLKRLFEARPITCAVNPQCGNEGSLKVVPAVVKRKIIVVGGGPGGMEAALVAAERGHQVELWEKTTALGGALIPASAPANKKELRRLIEYFKTQIYKRAGLRVRLNKCATSEALLAERPDAVVLATGGIPIVPNLPGLDGANVHKALDVLNDKRPLGRKVVVAGGGYVGCETAMHLAYQGKEVVLVEMLDQLLPEGGPINTVMMLKDIVKKSRVETRLKTKLISAEEGSVTVERDGRKEKISCDALVLALGFMSNLALEDELKAHVEVISIGDAGGARKVLEAVWEGFGAASSL